MLFCPTFGGPVGYELVQSCQFPVWEMDSTAAVSKSTPRKTSPVVGLMWKPIAMPGSK